VVDLALEEADVEAAAADVDKKSIWRITMKSKNMKLIFLTLVASFLTISFISAQQSTAKTAGSTAAPKAFATPDDAANALIQAAEKFDEAAFEQVFGSNGKDVVITDDPPTDKEFAKTFVEQAREKKQIVIDPKNKNRAVLQVGKEDWPFAIPLVKKGNQWSFDPAAGREEINFRRIGANELDAIEICRGFVEAQEEYAEEKHDGSPVNQYAQRIISSKGKQDGLAWQNADGKWAGPVGESAGEAIEKGYSTGKPYHGYYFKVLKGQGPAAPLGAMDYVVKGAMIGGFALAAAPSEYDVSGIKTFMVSNDGVVYEKDLGEKTLDEFKKMEVFNPDESWSPVEEEQ
jgi:hypothetical protein